MLHKCTFLLVHFDNKGFSKVHCIQHALVYTLEISCNMLWEHATKNRKVRCQARKVVLKIYHSSIHRFTHLFIHPFIHSFLHSSLYSTIPPFTYTSIYPFVESKYNYIFKILFYEHTCCTFLLVHFDRIFQGSLYTTCTSVHFGDFNALPREMGIPISYFATQLKQKYPMLGLKKYFYLFRFSRRKEETVFCK